MTKNPTTLLHKKLTSLATLSDSGMRAFFELAVQRQLLKGDSILRHGQICRTIVFVEKGYLRTFVEKDGVDVNTNFTFEGSFTTNLKSLRTSVPSDTTIEAGEPTTIYEFDKNQLLVLYDSFPEIETFGRNLLEQLLISQEEHANLFKIYSPTERYLHLLKHHPEIFQRLTLSQLASYLGMARETLSRVRKNVSQNAL